MKQLRNKSLKHFLRQSGPPTVELVFVLQDVEDPVNVGATFRIADACGIHEIVLAGISAHPPHPTIAGIGRGTHRRVPWHTTKYAADAIKKYKEDGYLACALEVASDAVPYHTVEYPEKVCLIVGNEYRGISRRTFEVCDMAIFLPMYGKVGSLNVHVALAVATYHILHK
ncbi:MAG: tRNA methyltransferase [Candidatus Poribacteria bacterium]|nr:tRNA methyltransferase [Candidatus Poribacteria bacterium]